MTDREIFDKVSAHLLKQRCRSEYMDENGFIHCAYRGQDSRKCAIGVLIPDELYFSTIEGKSVDSIILMPIPNPPNQKVDSKLPKLVKF